MRVMFRCDSGANTGAVLVARRRRSKLALPLGGAVMPPFGLREGLVVA
jgi:hypothetical protein